MIDENIFGKNDKFFSTKELSNLLKVNESTVKRWTDKGQLTCFKTPGGHRKYTSENISQFINNFHYEIISSKPDQIVQDPDLSGQDRLYRKNELAFFKKDCRAVSEAYFFHALKGEKENLLEILLNCSKAQIPLAAIYDEILMRALQKILSLKLNSKLSETDEHIIVTTITESIQQFGMIVKKAGGNGKIALCGVRENSLIGLQFSALAHLLEVSGWKVYNLGAWTSIEVFIKAIENYSPNLICASIDYLVKYQSKFSEAEMLLNSCKKRNSKILFSSFSTNPGNLLLPAGILNKLSFFNSFNEFLALTK